MKHITLTVAVLSFTSAAWAGPVKSGTLDFLRVLSPLPAVEPATPPAAAAETSGEEAKRLPWTWPEAQTVFNSNLSKGEIIDASGTWSRVARVADKNDDDYFNGVMDMRGLGVDESGGRIAFSRGNSPLTATLIYGQIQQENQRPNLLGNGSVSGRIVGKVVREQSTQKILSQRTYHCLQAGPDILLCQIQTLVRDDDSGYKQRLLEFYAYARLK